MKKYILPFVFLVIISTESKANQWMTSYEDARKMAIATNKLILVDFWAVWCGPCKRMDSESWSDAEVKSIMKNYVPLKIDIDRETELAGKYAVSSIPYVFILDPNGEVVFQRLSYMNKSEVIKLLKKYALSTKLLQTDFNAYAKNRTGDIALRIAEKYFDYAIYVDKSIKKDFLNLGDTYLKETYQLYKKEGHKKKESQRIHLLGDVYKILIKGKYEKALKILRKDFKEDRIEEKNKTLYDFLNFTVYNKLNDKENARLWYEKLKGVKDAKIFLMKSRKI